MGFADWFTIKTPAQRKKEARMYDRWAFPYGPAQKEKLQQIIRDLMPGEDPISGMAVFLIGREAYIGSFKADVEELAERTEEGKLKALDYALQGQLRGKYKKFIPYYKAMILADANITAELAYPSVEELKEMAEKLA